jgi:hypothetical protein
VRETPATLDVSALCNLLIQVALIEHKNHIGFIIALSHRIHAIEGVKDLGTRCCTFFLWRIALDYTWTADQTIVFGLGDTIVRVEAFDRL